MFGKHGEKENTELMPAKCAVTGEDFDISIQRRNGKLMMLNGRKRHSLSDQSFVSTSSSSPKEEMKMMSVEGGLYTEKTYHCPICGNKDIVRCGKCHRITCYDGSGYFKCAYCGNSGKVSGTIQEVHIHDSGIKKPIHNSDKSYVYGDKAYYPGDKPYYPGDKPGDK